ncbi:MAG: MMPL family transporter [Leptospirales bacterium]
MNKYILLLIEKIIEYPKRTLLLCGLVTVAFLFGLPKVKFDSSIEFLMPRQDPSYKLGERANMAFLNGKTFMITSIEPAEGEKLFSANVFQHINEMVEEIEEYKSFDRNLEDERLQNLIDLGSATIKKIAVETEPVESGDQSNLDDLESQLDDLLLSDEDGASGQAVEELLDTVKPDTTDIWDLNTPLPEERYVKPTRPKRTYEYKNYTPVSLKQIRGSLDRIGQKQLDTLLLVTEISPDSEEAMLAKHQYELLLEAWEDVYLYKSMEIVQTFMNPITGEDISGEDEELKPIDFIGTDESGNRLLPKSPADFKEYEEKIRLSPLNDKLLFSEAENGEIRALSMGVVLRSQEHYILFMDIFWPILDKYDHEPVVLYSLGNLVVEKFMSDFMKNDLVIYIPLVLLIVIITFFINFRSIRGVLLPTITVVIGAIWTMGLMGHLGFKMSMLVSILPPLLIAIGSSYSIHMFNQYLLEVETIRDSTRRQELLTKCMTHISVTVLLAAVTTFISFMTLSVSQVTSLRDFGMFAAVGALFSMSAAMVIIPSVLVLLKDLKVKKIQSSRAISHRAVLGFLRILSYFSIQHTKWVLGLFAIVFIAGVVGLSQVKLETSPMLNFKEDSYIRIADNRLGELFNGTSSLNLIIDSGEKGGAKDPEFLSFVENIRTWLKKPEQKEKHNILSESSFSDFIKRMNMAFHDDDPKYFSIPEKKSTIVDYLEVFAGEDNDSDGRADSFEQFTDGEYRRVNLIIRTGTYKDRVFTTALVEEIRSHVLNYIDTLDNPKNYTWVMAGNSINMVVLADYILRGQLTSVLLSLVIIAILIFVLFRKGVASLVSIIPISMGISVVYGMMGYLNIPLDIPKVILSSIAIGIGIDDTIHFMKTLAHHMGNGKDLNTALQETYNEAGVAITFTSIALVFGFSILTLSNFKPIYYLGILVASVMTATTFGALLFLPAFMKIFNIKMRNIEIAEKKD